jgi:HEAT repeat protein
VTIIQNLGAAGDKQSASALKELLADENQDVRLAAAGALARLGDATAAAALLKAREQEKGLARAQLSDACLELAQRLEAAGDKEAAQRIRANFD